MTDLEKALRILGVSPNDDAKTIRKAWRALVREYHPDTARTDPLGANKKLADINVAFDAVRACRSGELEKLRADIAERDRQKERARREALARQSKARQTRETAQKAARDKAYAARERQSHCMQGRSLRPLTRSEKNLRSLVARADKGFLEAMDVCSRLNFIRPSSSYM